MPSIQNTNNDYDVVQRKFSMVCVHVIVLHMECYHSWIHVTNVRRCFHLIHATPTNFKRFFLLTIFISCIIGCFIKLLSGKYLLKIWQLKSHTHTLNEQFNISFSAFFALAQLISIPSGWIKYGYQI